MTREEALKYAKFRLECYSKGDGEYTEHGEFLVAAIKALQEPEIVHCNDCKYWIGTEDIKQCSLAGYLIGERGYCLYGVRAGEKE